MTHTEHDKKMPEAYSNAWYDVYHKSWGTPNAEASTVLAEIPVGGVNVVVAPDITQTCAYDPHSTMLMVNPKFLQGPDVTEGEFTFNGNTTQAAINRGALLHEGAHVLFSKIALGGVSTLDQNVKTVIMGLEELRIEYNMLATIGRTKRLVEAGYDNDLRAGSHFIVKHNLPDGAMDPVQMSMSCALTVGRFDAGILTTEAAQPLYDLFATVYGDKLEALRDVWCRYLSLTDRDMDGRIALAKEWLNILGEPSGDENGKPEKQECEACKAEKEKAEKGDPDSGEGDEGDENGEGSPGGESGEGGDEEGEGEGSGEGEGEGEGNDGEGSSSGKDGKGKPSEHTCEGHGHGEGDGEGEGASGEGADGGLSDDLKDALDASYHITETDIMEANKNREQAARRAFMNSAEARRQNREAAAEKAHDKSHGFTDGGGPGHYDHRLYQAAETPTTDERKAMVTLAQELDRVTYVDKHTKKVNTLLPPGRMRGRAAVAMEAQKSKGLAITAEPWRTTKRKSVDKTPLTVGIIADVSGSMSSSVKAVSTAAWMLSEGVNRVHGRTTTVLMGDTAYGLIKPGERYEKIPRYNAVFGYEAFKDAYDAVDGSLNLSGGRGARILFCVTDSCFVSSEHERYAWEAMKEAKMAGIQVFWLDFDGYYGIDRYKNYGHGEVIQMKAGNPVANARIIGQTVIKAFEKVKNV